jgi:putative ABC transport system permease protein
MTRAAENRSSRRSVRALRGLALAEAKRRPARVLVTIGTIAMGSGALTSALILGASVQKAVDDGIKVELANVDIVQQTDQSNDEQSASGGGSDPVAATPADLRNIRGLEGVKTVGTLVRTSAVAQTGSTSRGIRLESLNSSRDFQWQRWSQGRAPAGPGEIGLSQYTLDALRISDGDFVAVGHPGVGTKQYRVVGVVDTRGSAALQGSAYGIVDDAVAQAIAGIDGPNTIELSVKSGVDPAVVLDGVNRVAPIGLPQLVGDIVSARRAVQLGQINAMSAVVAALAGVSCLVAAVTSATTTGASLATRRRTWALIRCVGAGKRHVAGLVAAEALILGSLGAAVGTLAGTAVARLALPLVGLVPSLPHLRGSAFTVRPSAVVLPMVVSVLLALLGAIGPAVLAARIPPSAALKAGASPAPGRSRRRTVVGLVGVIGGSVVAVVAAGKGLSPLAAAGALGLLLGVGIVLSPMLTWTSRLAARRTSSAAVRLGFLDVVRRPRAATIEAVAVLLAVGMISLSWVALSSVQAATSARLTASPLPDLTVGAVLGSSPVSDVTVSRLRSLKSVSAVVPIRLGDSVDIKGRGPDGAVTLSVGTAAGKAEALSSALPDGFPVAKIRDDTVYMQASAFPPFFKNSRVTLNGPAGHVAGLKISYIADLPLPSVVSPATLARVSKTTAQRLVWVSLKAGVDRAAVIDQVVGLALLDGQVPVGGPAVLDTRVAAGLATARAAAVAILAISVLVAVIGAAATAALSITERTREHATLRALGLERPALGRLLAVRVLFVSAMATLIGITVGAVLGVVAARLIVNGLKLSPKTALPLLPVFAVAAVTVLAVRVAALVPMERASLIPPSRAMAEG